MLGRWFFLSSLICIAGVVTQPLSAGTVPQPLQEVGITEHLGATLPMGLVFSDENGNRVTLGDYAKKGKPILLALIYYSCPNLCNYLLNGVTETLQKMEWKPGQEFELVAVSIDPSEKPELAAKKKASYLKFYGKPETADGWHLLTGDKESIQALAGTIGFRYRYDDEQQQYAHSAAVYTVTTEGRLSRYLYGIQFKPQDLKFALLEAARGRIGTVMERLILFCFSYDPIKRGYSLVLSRLMQIAGALTVLGVGTYLTVFWVRERRFASIRGNGA